MDLKLIRARMFAAECSCKRARPALRDCVEGVCASCRANEQLQAVRLLASAARNLVFCQADRATMLDGDYSCTQCGCDPCSPYCSWPSLKHALHLLERDE